MLQGGLIIPPVAAAQSGGCISTGPDTLAYSMRICLDSPEEGAELSGAVAVSGTVAVEWGAAPPIKHVQFYFTHVDREDSSTVLRDYVEPFAFTLPTERWSDRSYRLEMSVTMIDRWESARAGVNVTTSNGVTRVPTSTGRWIPKEVTEGPVVVAAVGDGAGGMPGSYEVSNLIEGWNPDMFLYLGDIYNSGSYTEFINHYEPTFGGMRDITNPVPGDHEGGRHFQGFRDYWDSNQHYYAVTAGSWRLFGLDSTERFGETASGTAQFQWLQKQLESTENTACTMVFMHTPAWGQSRHSDYTYMNELWRLLASEGVDILVAGHEHNYQRWTPMDADGVPHASGTTQFVVGTGGHDLVTHSQTDARLVANHQGQYGALQLTLSDGEAAFKYIDTAGNVLDSGTIPCTGSPEDAAEVVQAQSTGTTGTIDGTSGRGALCLAGPDYNAAVIAVLPDGTQVELRGEPIGDWQPVRCADQDGYVVTWFIRTDD
jgi:hypothetical protein